MDNQCCWDVGSLDTSQSVSEVFPKARNCFCLWYIIQRVQDKLGELEGFESINR